MKTVYILLLPIVVLLVLIGLNYRRIISAWMIRVETNRLEKSALDALEEFSNPAPLEDKFQGELSPDFWNFSNINGGGEVSHDDAWHAAAMTFEDGLAINHVPDTEFENESSQSRQPAAERYNNITLIGASGFRPTPSSDVVLKFSARTSENFYGTAGVIFQPVGTLQQNGFFASPFDMFGFSVVGEESSIQGFNGALCYLALNWLPVRVNALPVDARSVDQYEIRLRWISKTEWLGLVSVDGISHCEMLMPGLRTDRGACLERQRPGAQQAATLVGDCAFNGSEIPKWREQGILPRIHSSLCGVTMKIPRLLRLPDTFDPDDRRRRQVLNLILAFFIGGGLVSIITTFSYGDSFQEIIHDQDGLLILLSSLAVVVVFTLLFLLNRWERAGTLAGWLFVLSLIAIVSISDSPNELVERGLIVWTLPILAGGIVLPPLAVFMVATIVSAANLYITAMILHVSTNPYAYAIYFVLAALTWLGMSIAGGAIRTARMEAQKNAAILDGVADGVVVLNAENQVVLANPVALSLMGSGLAQLASQGNGQQELSGRVLAFEWSDVKDVGRVAIVRDVSRQVEVKRARDAMLGVVSHEMRTPLAAIIGFAEVIALRNDMATAFAERIRVNAQRLTYMVNDLLDHAQMQSGTLKIPNEPFSPASLLLLVKNLLSGLAEQKSLKLTTHVDAALPELIIGDNSRLQQILVNLIGNAIKFTEYGEISASVKMLGTEWQMIVQDTGIGIPAERLPDVFEPFRRGSDYATRRHQGAGLGLSIVKKLVALMEGRIDVQSTVGQGSVFTVTLPLKKANDQL